MPQTLTDIKAMLADAGLHPKKRFGQNFLHDHNQMRRIIEAADLREGECVLEVGAGTGALTQRLLDAGARVIAVEVDRDLEPLLRPILEPYGNRATLLIADVLDSKHEINAAVHRLVAAEPFKLIANLPYNVASPLLVNLLADYEGMSHAVVMIQREVAERLTAPPGGKDYGPLSVMVQALGEVERVAVLKPSCFWPAPKVESTVVRITRRAQPLTDNPQTLAKLLHKLFSKRRKQVGTILGKDDVTVETLRRLKIDSAARSETLSVEQLAALARQLNA